MSLSFLWIRTLGGYTRADQVIDVSVARLASVSGRGPRSDTSGDYMVEISLPASGGDAEHGFSTDTRAVARNLTHNEAVDVVDQLVTDLIELPTSRPQVSVLAVIGGNVEHYDSPGEYRSQNPDS